MTVRETYPFTRMEECIDLLGGAAVFFTTHCNNGYWQTKVPESKLDKTTLASLQGPLQLIRISFELKFERALFKRAVEIVMSTVNWQRSLV